MQNTSLIFYFNQQTQNYPGRLLHKCIDAYLQWLCLAHPGLVANSSQTGSENLTGQHWPRRWLRDLSNLKGYHPAWDFLHCASINFKVVKMSKDTPMSWA